jgi:hypothetical protein
MSAPRKLFLAAMLFFCVWAAILARLKGYRARCWLLAGPAGVLVLCCLPLVGACEPRRQAAGNRLGLFLSLIFLAAAWLAREFL